MKSELFFSFAYDQFLDARSRAGEVSRFYRLAGFTFRMQFAGDAMVDLLSAACKHLEVEATEDYDLTICIWDSASTRTAILKDRWSFSGARGEVFELNCDAIYTVLDIHTQALNIFHKTRKCALYWISDWRLLPWWVNGSPLQLILHWWMREKGYQLTHAAVVGWPHGGVLLAGKSGSGKSTTTLACMKAGMRYVSEDYCLLSDVPEIRAYSVYNSAKINDATLQWFPELAQQVENGKRSRGDKAFLFHQKFQPEKILLNAPVRAILSLSIVNERDSFLESIDLKETVAALSISTMWQLTHTGPAVFKHLKRVAEALPCFRLRLGYDLDQAPALIGEILCKSCSGPTGFGPGSAA